MRSDITVIGAGLAGSEAAWQAASMGCSVTLFEMRPVVTTPAHSSPHFAELVCSNSLGADRDGAAPGLLKEELRALGSLILECADSTRVPAGQALAVDRELFGKAVTARLEACPNVRIVRGEVTEIPNEGITVIATGPLTSPALLSCIARILGEEQLFFFDAAAPIVDGGSIDWSRVFWASRYGKGEADYVNCPMSEEEYDAFWNALTRAEVAQMHGFESLRLFEGCMPVEEIARRGRDTLSYGPMKPVGLADPRSGVRPFAVVQLRKENSPGSLFNLVGFQTRLARPEQRKVFRMIPGLEHAEFVRYGMMHRNTYINSPAHLLPTLQLKAVSGEDAAEGGPHVRQVLMAGQITGVEGYIESASMGLVAGLNSARLARGLEPLIFPRATAIGALCSYICTHPRGEFQPMNVNFGLLPAPPSGTKKQDRRQGQIEAARSAMHEVVEAVREMRSAGFSAV
ncbi:MAG: methylenetetrahydrofolate--tRNA-(uracil(54)-C(5))-methyltransferase (FADH(2)-oxidizing) TrmFO [Clostridia bacterium]|nr:methylenetetrahydrofolate--tRNA-(uracil(54)-C(5))-methyltransferase (FADH(2)-oxidizing) TrmFO [Clostridia bacterium]